MDGRRDEQEPAFWPTKSLAPRRITVVFACRPEQQAYELRKGDQKAPAHSGQFTYLWFEGVRKSQADHNADSQVSRREAFDYSSTRLAKQFNNVRPIPADRQKPLFESSQAESAVFSANRRQSK